jgi:hypothetical protein
MEEKEIWKLLELLNEYEKEVRKSEYYEWEKWIWWPNNLFRRDTRDEEWSHLYSNTADTYVISKKYGFIQRLVEQDKIDTDAYKTVYSWDLDKWKTLTREIWWDDFYQVTEHWVYESLLMLLTISDTPIDDLIYYLK